MKKIVSLIILVVAVIVYFIFGNPSLRPAPTLSMTSLSGQLINTQNRNNKLLLMTFWATTCSSCVKEMPHLIELQKQHSQHIDIAGIAMSYDNIDHVHEMVKRRQLNYNIVYDQNDTIAQSFGGIRLTPTSFLISAQGQIIYQKIGDIDFTKIKQLLSEIGQKG